MDEYVRRMTQPLADAWAEFNEGRASLLDLSRLAEQASGALDNSEPDLPGLLATAASDLEYAYFANEREHHLKLAQPIMNPILARLGAAHGYVGQDRRLDLLSEMYVLTAEQSYLHEVTSQVVDHLGDDNQVVHGPWTPAECQPILSQWLDASWLELIADLDPPPSDSNPAGWHARATVSGEYLVLAAEDARALLAEPDRWRVGAADGNVMLCRTEEGDRHDYAEWAALAGERLDT
ncbi:hypothetical protein [Aeromicrobium sp.]